METASLHESALEAIESEFSGCINDIITSTIESDPARFLDAHNVCVDRAEQSFIAFDFNWEEFKLALSPIFSPHCGQVASNCHGGMIPSVMICPSQTTALCAKLSGHG